MIKIEQLKITEKIFFFTLSSEIVEANIIIIKGKNNNFILDTFLGPDSVKHIINRLQLQDENKNFVVFNSHYHWDHIWGNCYFNSKTHIISHENCLQEIQNTFNRDFKLYGKHSQGDVVKRLPNLTFTDKLIYKEDNVEFFFTPGHTIGSSSCLVDEVLYVGDNLEAPFPYINQVNLSLYSKTLETYIKINPQTILSGHGLANEDLLQSNLEYLKQLENLTVNTDIFNDSNFKIHLSNLDFLIKEYYKSKNQTQVDNLIEVAISNIKNANITKKEEYLKLAYKLKEKLNSTINE